MFGIKNTLSELDVTAYHEAGHAVVMTLLGKQIECIKLFYLPGGTCYGDTPPDSSTDVMVQWIVPYLNGFVLPNDAQLHPYPDDEYKDVRITCTIKCAGLVVEKRMGINVSLMEPGGSRQDIGAALHFLNQTIPLGQQRQELYNSEIRAEELLSNVACWNMVVDLGRYLIDAVHHGQELIDSVI